MSEEINSIYSAVSSVSCSTAISTTQSSTSVTPTLSVLSTITEANAKSSSTPSSSSSSSSSSPSITTTANKTSSSTPLLSSTTAKDANTRSSPTSSPSTMAKSTTSTKSSTTSLLSSSKEKTTNDNTLQILKWILNQICFRGLKVLIELENEFSNIESTLTSSQRLEFFTKMINIACNTSYDKSIIVGIHNVINMNENIKNDLLGKIDMNELIITYTMLNKNDTCHIDKNLIKVMPFTDVCTNKKCQGQKLDTIFSKNGHILYPTSTKSCSIYIGTCKICKCIYQPSSILDTNANQRTVIVQCIKNNNYICFYGNLVYTKELLTMFSNYLVHAHVTFEGFAQSYIATLEDVQINYSPIFSANSFAKRLEITWMYYELSRFIFVTSRESYIIFPKSCQPIPRSIFIEQNLRFLYHLFIVFWSHHQMINGIKCKQSSCSQVMLIDGHQKCRRIICKFPNVTNMSHPEMGPVLHGCPYAPKRKKKDQDTTDDESIYYCSHHGEYMKSVDDFQQLHTHEYEEALEIDRKIVADLNNADMCNVYRNELEKNQKNRSFGVLVSFLSCNVVVGFTESIKSEGCRRVTDHLLTMLKDGAQLPDSLIYDNACALRLHWNKVYDTQYLTKNEHTTKLYNLVLALDRFHRKGHVRPMCKKLMNPDDKQHGDKFKHINTSICEQFFSFLTKFRFALRGFNYPTSTLFTLLLFHLKNCHTTSIKKNDFGLGYQYFNDKIKDHFINPCIFESVIFDIHEQQRTEQWIEGEQNIQKLDPKEFDEQISEDEFSEEEYDGNVETDSESFDED
ncbi:unnamed protein product [Adineta steineri]|uniref:Uncharacterized protein n=1 Tax=Adineta steineri TaxID=433720 RepID=A0A819EHD0_9BILA|nr:unnamed protein product [Adineta steineri]